MTFKRILLLLAFGAAVAAGGSLAGAEDQSKDNVDLEAVRAAVNELKQKKVVDLLALENGEEEAFLGVYNRWEEVRWAYRERRNVLVEELRAALTETPDSRPLGKILDDVDAVDAESRGSEDRLRKEFRQLLSEEQYAKLLLFEHGFNLRLRRLVQEQQRQAPPHAVEPATP
jgi:hypothetical protein